MECPNCGSKYLKCPECGRIYNHGEISHCENLSCEEMNTPLDCSKCGLTISSDLKGVLTLEMDLIPYQ